MENASKALIIAGAILLSILIIGLGMFIYQMAFGATEDISLDPQKINAYNSPFTTYEGDKVSGARARALCDVVRNHNNAHQSDSTQQIHVYSESAADKTTPPEDNVPVTEITDVKNGLKAGLTYTVDFGYDVKTGYVVAVGITVNQSGTGGSGSQQGGQGN